MPNGIFLNCEYEKLLEPLFSDLSLYQDCYKSTKNCILALKKLNDLIGFPLEEGPQEYRSFIYDQLNKYSGEV